MNVKTRKLVTAAICVALATVLSYIKVFRMPQGGSVSLEMLPLIVMSIALGPWWGMGGGAVCGLLQMIFGGYILTPLQAALDYPVAFGLLGLAGFLRNCWFCGALLGVAGRWAAEVVCGVVFFGRYAPEGQSPLVYNMVYSATYLVPALIVTLIGLWLVVPRLTRWIYRS